MEYTNKCCTACHQDKSIGEFRTRKQHGRPYIVAMCRPCERKRSQIQVDKTKKLEYARKRFACPERRKIRNEQQRKWRAKNIEKNREYHRRHIKKQVDELSDIYVKRMLEGEKRHSIITKEMIELKRNQLLIKRIKKLINNGEQQND